MHLRLLPTLLVAAALLATGCVSKEDPAASTTDNAGASEVVVQANASGASASANATAMNATAEGNNTKAEDMPSDPSNCMRGMDMQGCTAAQADAYFEARKVNAPPPDKELPPVVIALDAQGANAPGAFTLEPGTMTLLVEIFLNDTGQGPYAALGPDGSGDLTLSLVGPAETTKIALSGRNVGVNPATMLSQRSTAIVSMPAIGDWTVTLEGHGTNVQVEVRLIERFYM